MDGLVYKNTIQGVDSESTVGCWLLVVGCWLLVVGCWLLVVGCWLLVVGCWLLVVCLDSRSLRF